MSAVTVITGSRLHFGPLAVGAQAGRQFGGIGIMIDSPGVKLTVSRAEQEDVITPAEIASRIQQAISRWRQVVGSTFPVQVAVADFIPVHQGLGSGTQLALAVAQAMQLLHAGKRGSVQHLAKAVCRGRRSAIGIHGFEQGGFLIDAGKHQREEIGTLAARCDVPADWRFVLISPKDAAGLSGEQEAIAFAEMKPMPPEFTGRLCRLALMELLPAIRVAEFAAFASALDEFGTLVGEFFAPIQGSGFAHPAMNSLAAHLRRNGVPGLAQSSWGPTVAVIQSDPASAHALANHLACESRWGALHCRVVSPLNGGAVIKHGERP